jgi:hypothetical protein
VPSHGSLAADLNKILEHRRPRYANLRHDHAAPPDADIVPNLHEVIDACSSADDSILS